MGKINNMLYVAGEFTELTRQAGRSLLGYERVAILNARMDAIAAGMGARRIAFLERTGAHVIRRGTMGFWSRP